jgi:hypothetical protein
MSLLKVLAETHAEIDVLRKNGNVALTGHDMSIASVVTVARSAYFLVVLSCPY